jgi:hypothetical protein
MTIEELLIDELDAEFETLRTAKPGTEEHKAAGDMLVKLLDRKIEMDKVENDAKDKAEIRESDKLLKEQQFKDEKKDRLIKNIISAAGVALPLLVTIWGTKVSLKFEEEGTFTTIMGRGFINKLLPKK